MKALRPEVKQLKGLVEQFIATPISELESSVEKNVASVNDLKDKVLKLKFDEIQLQALTDAFEALANKKNPGAKSLKDFAYSVSRILIPEMNARDSPLTV